MANGIRGVITEEGRCFHRGWEGSKYSKQGIMSDPLWPPAKNGSEKMSGSEGLNNPLANEIVEVDDARIMSIVFNHQLRNVVGAHQAEGIDGQGIFVDGFRMLAHDIGGT